MKVTVLAAMLALALLPVRAPAQISLQVQLGTPLPPTPVLLAVQPGIQVVSGYPEELFVVNHHYYLRREGAWYRSVHPATGFVYVAPTRIPPGLARLPPGHYRHYSKERAKADRLAAKVEKKERKHDRSHDRESGHGHH